MSDDLKIELRSPEGEWTDADVVRWRATLEEGDVVSVRTRDNWETGRFVQYSEAEGFVYVTLDCLQSLDQHALTWDDLRPYYVCAGCDLPIVKGQEMVGSDVFSIYAHKVCEEAAQRRAFTAAENKAEQRRAVVVVSISVPAKWSDERAVAAVRSACHAADLKVLEAVAIQTADLNQTIEDMEREIGSLQAAWRLLLIDGGLGSLLLEGTLKGLADLLGIDDQAEGGVL